MTLELLASRVDAMEKSKCAWEGLCREMLATITLEANKDYFSVLDDTWHKSVEAWINRFHNIEAAEQCVHPTRLRLWKATANLKNRRAGNANRWADAPQEVKVEEKKLYSINELIIWLETYPGWQGSRPLKYAEYARKELKAAQHRLHLTAFGVGTLAFFAGFGICWLAFVR